MNEIAVGCRIVLASIAGVLSFVAGHHMRQPGSGESFAAGLLAYALGLLAFAYAADALRLLRREAAATERR